jgi:hypothetical protein
VDSFLELALHLTFLVSLRAGQELQARLVSSQHLQVSVIETSCFLKMKKENNICCSLRGFITISQRVKNYLY